jgi:hypothetical protein
MHKNSFIIVYQAGPSAAGEVGRERMRGEEGKTVVSKPAAIRLHGQR